MSNVNLKKLLISNIPYLLFIFLFDKVAQAVRLSPGADFSGKFLSIGDGFAVAFSSAVPSFDPVDLLIGIAGAVFIWVVVYMKGRNAKKYRKGMEYGSARWRAFPSMIQIVVKDNGVGIHPEDLPHTFKRFYRSRFSKDTQGIGLGLPPCQDNRRGTQRHHQSG